jgi:hypothetical protein
MPGPIRRDAYGERRCSTAFVQQLRPVVMGPGSRFAWPGRRELFPRRGLRPKFCKKPSAQERAQGKPGARCTRGLVCKMHIRKRTRAYRFSGGNPAFPARWCYGLLRALPGDRAFLSPSSLRSLLLKNLTPASRRQDHTTSPSATSARSSSAPRASTASDPNVRDDGQRPSFGIGRRGHEGDLRRM